MRQEMMITRRRSLKGASSGAVLTGPGVSFLQLLETEAAVLDLPAELPEGTRAEAILDVLPGKRPLIKLAYRPPNYETPIEYFRRSMPKRGSCPSAARVPMGRPSSLSTTCRRCRLLK